MEQIFIPYWEWEDWKNGMYKSTPKEEEKKDIKKAKIFMSQTDLFGKNMKLVISEWGNTMLNSLTNSDINKEAFVGQCACCYAIGVTESITKKAWHSLDLEKQIKANKIARYYINEYVSNYERKNRKIHKDMGRQMLFDWDS